MYIYHSARIWGMRSKQNALVRFYAARINPDAKPIEAYGYWLIVVASVAAAVGIASFLWGSSFPRGEETYWAYRQAGIAVTAVALPVAIFGMTFRLPLQPAASAVGAVGIVVCAGAVVWFVTLYPSGWTFTGPRPVILTYTGGIFLLSAGLIGVPFFVPSLPPDRDPETVAQPHYSLVRLSDGWTWRLYGSDGSLLARGERAFGERSSARKAIDRISTKAPTGGVEVTDAGFGTDGDERRLG